MRYIIHRRFKGTSISGEINLPALTICELENNILFHDGKPLCYATSENAHQHFALDTDGCGLERGKLTQAIMATLAKRDENYQARWDKVWEDKLCQKYKKEEYDDYWLWNHAWYNAPILDLRYIAGLVGAKIG
ncbi:MAG: isoaspartyl peptidase [Clostridia bacterium]|nr:isoaspartyl peptidase [Clostridia bacterium]